VQGELEARFSRLLGESIRVVAASRTDAGVHALGQVINFVTTRPIALARLPQVLNAALPPDVKVQHCQEVGEEFHARRSARSKIYRYTAIERARPSPMLGRYALVVPAGLGVEQMAKAARRLVGRRDFRAFQGRGADTKNTDRTLIALTCRRAGNVVTITAEADSFLYQMVRIVVSALLAVGREQMKATELVRALAARDRSRLPGPAPACGLCLLRVSY